MRPVFISFGRFVKEIFKDAMLVAITILPLLLGLLIKFGIPLLETFLENQFGLVRLLAPCYILFDLTVILSTPIMFGYAGLMVLLEERDSGVLKYLCVTPLGMRGYIVLRLVFLSAIASVYDFVVEIIFHLSPITFMQITLGCAFSFLTGIWIICLIASLASNKVEGLAFSKFTGILILGPLAAFFIKDGVKYIAGFLPTFWFTEYCLNPNVYGIVSLAVSFVLTLVYVAITIPMQVRRTVA